ncbi:MAG: M1 family metallopeptidase [Myxococcales bacterium]|nr:M1 family metallopeptidase [Myxococcales bacterium]
MPASSRGRLLNLRAMRAAAALLSISLCSVSSLAAPPAKGPNGAKRYLSGRLPVHEPRDQTTDITNMLLKVTIDPAKRSAQGDVTYKGVTLIDQPAVILHAVDLDIAEATLLMLGKTTKLPTKTPDHQLHIALPKAPVGTPFEVHVRWKVIRPAMGLFFIHPNKDAPKRPMHVWTQGETHGIRHWVPSPDHPDERMTWQLQITAPRTMRVLSNGAPGKVTPRGKLHTAHFRIDKPYPLYLLNVAIGPFQAHRHPHKRVQITSWATAEHAPRVGPIGKRTGEMLDVFEKLTGTRYPHKRYGHVYVDEFTAGGMENITLTTLTTRAIGTPATDHGRTIDGLLAHELAHQWFGDLVTCRTWADLWLNEGFATYYQKLWTWKAYGLERFAEQMAGARRSAMGADAAIPRPVVSDRYRDPSDLFDGHAYPKGAWVLHMLRERLGHAVFDAGIAAYLKAHRHQSVETADLRRALERVSHRSLRGFFKRWLRQPGGPRLTAKLQWRSKTKQLQVRLKQRQAIDGQRPAFNLPVEVAIATDKGIVRRVIALSGKTASLTLPLGSAPSWVMVDPDMRLLASWKIKASADLVLPAAKLAPHPDARLRAVHALRGHLDRRKVVVGLTAVMRHDKARHVRAAAAKILGAARRDAVAKALRRALRKDKSAHVRRAAAAALGQLHDTESLKLLKNKARADKSDSVRKSCLRAVFAIDRIRARALLLAALRWPSWRNHIEGTALMLLAKLADGRDFDRIWKATTAGHPKSLRAVASLALAAYAVRVRATRDHVRGQLESLLQEDSVKLRYQAVAALKILSLPASARPLQAAAAREPHFRLADRMRRAAGSLGQKLPVEERIRSLESALRRLERRSHEGKRHRKGEAARKHDKRHKRPGPDKTAPKGGAKPKQGATASH